MGCCNTIAMETEIIISQLNTIVTGECSEKFNDIPLSSQTSPLKFNLVQEDDFKNTTTRLSCETMSSSSIPYSRLSIEMAFVCGKL